MNIEKYNTAERRRLAATGQALPDGSFPIVTRQDLLDAIRLVGRARDYNRARRHIIGRARDMGLVELLPESWNVKAAATRGKDTDDESAGHDSNERRRRTNKSNVWQGSIVSHNMLKYR